MRLAKADIRRKEGEDRVLYGLHISHQTGAELIALPFHTTELMKKFKQPSPDQNMNRIAPVFQA